MPEQRDDDGAAREQHGPTGGVHRLDDRLARVAECRPGRHVRLAKARQDEQRVVDADAEPDHRRELGGEVRRVDDVREQRDRAESRAQPEQRGDDRQAHRDHRAERQQQHDDRGQQPDGRGDAEARLLGLPRSPVRRARPAGPAVPAARATFTTRSAAALRQVVGLFVEHDRRERDPAVRRRSTCPRRRRRKG